MRPALVTVLFAAALTLAACGGDKESTPSETTAVSPTVEATPTETETTSAEPSESPGEFLERILGYETKGQHGRAWDALHPGHQRLVTRERFDDCRSQRFENVSVEIVSFDVIETYDDPINIVGVPEKTSKAVTYRLRARSGDQTETVTDTAHAVQLGDEWVWLLTQSDARDYKAGTCPT